MEVELEVEHAGEVVLPPELLDRLRLAPGDLLWLEPGALSLRLEIFQEILAGDWEGLSQETARHFAEELLGRPSTAILAAGRLPIPADLLPLASGDRLVLQVVRRGLYHEMFLHRERADGRDGRG